MLTEVSSAAWVRPTAKNVKYGSDFEGGRKGARKEKTSHIPARLRIG